jgi:hypothetical protein
MSKNILLLGVYGLELVEAGGALALNARNGGKSFASIMLAAETMKENVKKAGEILGVSKVYFNGFKKGDVACNHSHKVELVRVIRETKPDIIITQDPEGCVGDFDPDRRPAMTLLLEAISLASRDFATDELPGLDPHPVPKIYYMTPHHPNCVINVSPVWDLLYKATEAVSSQLEFTARIFEKKTTSDVLEIIIPGYKALGNNYYEKGRRLHHARDMANYMHYGIGGHGTFALAEAYKYEGYFEFKELD